LKPQARLRNPAMTGQDASSRNVMPPRTRDRA
jgi:hypothetical protein